VLVQSKPIWDLFSKDGFRTFWFPSGVDVAKFSPVSKARRLELRKQYGLKEDDFIVLHVGHIRPNRNLEELVPIQRQQGIQVVVAGSTSFQADEKTHQQLRDAGCIVWIRYFPRVEELFQLSDCYVFPVTTTDGAVQIPLTILEAAACNLPVVTTPFGGLLDLVGQRVGLFYIRTPAEMQKAVEECRNCSIEPRKWSVEFSWQNIVDQLIDLYRSCLRS